VELRLRKRLVVSDSEVCPWVATLPVNTLWRQMRAPSRVTLMAGMGGPHPHLHRPHCKPKLREQVIMPNPFIHCELATKDLPKARTFYAKLFDWKLIDYPDSA
jgi:hypothetical protein